MGGKQCSDVVDYLESSFNINILPLAENAD
jgi:hypothetical protein